MLHTSDDLLKLIHNSNALSIWDRNKGPVFWYTAGVPGPFFVNTEWIIGRELAGALVEKITKIVEDKTDLASCATALDQAVMTAYKSSTVYRQVVAALVEKAKQEFTHGTYTLVSGGERRDWLFSIPFAHELGLRHVFLFKDETSYCAQPLHTDEGVLHISDLINNAASYFERWLPGLQKAHLRCVGTLCVNSRGTGAAKLEEAGISVVPLVRIDMAFFEQSVVGALIDSGTLHEITCHARSPQEWAEKYLFTNPAVFDVEHVDKKSFERLRSFFSQDPWSLRSRHEALFQSMQAAIAARHKSAA